MLLSAARRQRRADAILFTQEVACDRAGPISTLGPRPPCPAPADLPWYRTVLRGSGFQLNASDLPHPASKTRSRAAFPPTAAIPGRGGGGSISGLAELRQPAEGQKHQHICRKREIAALVGPSVYQKHVCHRSYFSEETPPTNPTHTSLTPKTRTRKQQQQLTEAKIT